MPSDIPGGAPAGTGGAVALLYSVILYSMKAHTSSTPSTNPSSISSTIFPTAMTEISFSDAKKSAKD